MKIKIISIICYLLLLTSVITFASCQKKDSSDDNKDNPEEKFIDYIQEIDYSESTNYILNPDQGFYRTSSINLGPNAIKSVLAYDEDFQLYHLRIDISGYSKIVNKKQDLDLTREALDELDKDLKFYLDRGKNVIVRFSYDQGFSGNANFEPSIGTMVNHIKQASLVLNKYLSVITAIEVGMVGPWGEMHTSNAANPTTINRLIDAFLDNTNEVPILVRTPQMIYNYFGITINDLSNYRIDENHKAYRLGMFNDGYLGSETDLGTYNKREIETTWLSQQTNHLPYGGEVTIPSSSLHNIERCLPEMFKLHLSYLNYEWNNDVVQNKWCKTYYSKSCGDDALYYGMTAFDYIRNHFGYRFVLTNSTFSVSPSKLKITLELTNVGFGNLWREKNITVILNNDKSTIFINGLGTFLGEETINTILDISNIESGNYDVYLALNTKLEDNYIYPIYFANSNIIDYNLKANYIGTFQKQ